MIAQGLSVPISLQSSAYLPEALEKDRCRPQRPRRQARCRRRDAGFPGL